MSREALPCIACGKELLNVFDDCENQPEDGVAFQSEGHYGSTVWDPMSMAFIEINVCDECLRKHHDRVLQGRAYKPVMCRGVFVGRTADRRPLMPWNPEDDDDGGQPLEVDPEDIYALAKDGSPLYPEIQWARSAYEVKRSSSTRGEASGE